MPRAKRWLYDSGIRVPLIVRAPGRIKPGATRDDLVSFIDFAPTTLALAGAEIPERLQGHIFLGDKRAKAREYAYAAADRMDKAIDRIRAVRDERSKYIRNFHPELPYAQRIPYNEENPAMRVWRQSSQEGRLSGPTAVVVSPTKPKEELYDTEADPDEVRNLATDPKYLQTLERMRKAMDAWIRTTKDMGQIPEEELIKRGVVRNVLKE